MKKLITVLVLVGASLGLVACGGDSGDSSSGGGGDLNLTGNWKVAPYFKTPGVTATPFDVQLTQSGNIVSGSGISTNPPGTIDCGDRLLNVEGVVSGNMFNGSVSSNVSTTSFELSGSSDSLSGSFKTVYHSGYCQGTYYGSMTMSRI